MKISPDFLLYKEELKKRISLWRNFALLALFAFVFYYMLSNYGFKQSTAIKDYVARITIDDTILEDSAREKKLRALANDKKVKAVILYVNSPGGSMFGGESTYLALRKIAEKKPLVAVMGTVAASAGYMIAIAADHVVAQNSTITGSIGTLIISAEISELAKKIGVNFIVLKSGDLKAEPLPFHALNQKVKEATMSMLMDNYEVFVDMVTERRKLNRHDVYKIADGRAFTGRQAIDNKLIDAIGNEDEALRWLQDKRAVDKKLSVLDFNINNEKRKFEQFFLEPLDSMASWIKSSLLNKLLLESKISLS